LRTAYQDIDLAVTNQDFYSRVQEIMHNLVRTKPFNANIHPHFVGGDRLPSGVDCPPPPDAPRLCVRPPPDGPPF
jgi:hypothetical protein